MVAEIAPSLRCLAADVGKKLDGIRQGYGIMLMLA
jgi:hypothetical protein